MNRPTPRLSRIRRRTAATGTIPAPVCICAACGDRIANEAVFHLPSGPYHYRCLPEVMREMFRTGR
jgi:hypothetical protein